MTMPDRPTERVDRALAALREPPSVSADQAARVAARAVLGARRQTRWTQLGRPLLAAAALAAVLGIAVVRQTPPSTSPVASATTGRAEPDSSVAMIPVAASSATTLATVPRPIVFAVQAPAARVVRVVGDFNQWSRGSHTMVRDADGTWRLTALVPPGRYVFAYLVDDRRWVRDSTRAPVDDPDFGIAGSELVVGVEP